MMLVSRFSPHPLFTAESEEVQGTLVGDKLYEELSNAVKPGSTWGNPTRYRGALLYRDDRGGPETLHVSFVEPSPPQSVNGRYGVSVWISPRTKTVILALKTSIRVKQVEPLTLWHAGSYTREDAARRLRNYFASAPPASQGDDA